VAADAPPGSTARAIVRALIRALPLLFSARLLALILLPLLASWLAWFVVALFAWTPVSHAIAQVLGGAAPGVFSSTSAQVVTMLLWLALVLITSLLIVGVFAMPAILKVVVARHFPELEHLRGGTLAGSVGNALFAVVRFVLIWMLSLLLLPLAPLYLLVSLANTAALNARLFRYDALAEHASPAELRGVIARARGRWFLLGLALSPLSWIPLINFIAPLYSGIAFACLALDELARLRRATMSTGNT